jgi:hypothetical protein
MCLLLALLVVIPLYFPSRNDKDVQATIDQKIHAAATRWSAAAPGLATPPLTVGTNPTRPVPPLADRNIPGPRISQGNFNAVPKAMVDARKKAKTAVSPALHNQGENPVLPREPTPYMRHRLRARILFWRSFAQSTLVLKWITDGFDLQWLAGMGPPPIIFLPNHVSAFQHKDFVSASIAELLSSGSAEMVSERPRVVMPLGVVAKKGGDKFRLIYDARRVNKHLLVPSFFYEDLGACENYILPKTS